MAPKLPPVNATLIEVRGPGTEDYGTVYPGPVKWAGDAPANVTESVLIETGTGTHDEHKVARVVIPSYIDAVPGDQLTWTKGGAAATTRTARNVEDRSDFGFTRIYMEDA